MCIPKPECSQRKQKNLSHFCPSKSDLCIDTSSSAMTPTHWRDQRVVVQSISRSAPMSNFSVPLGVSAFPHYARGGGGPSPYIPRSTSLVFHPVEMLYGVGGPDGTGKFSLHP